MIVLFSSPAVSPRFLGLPIRDAHTVSFLVDKKDNIAVHTALTHTPKAAREECSGSLVGTGLHRIKKGVELELTRQEHGGLENSVAETRELIRQIGKL